MILLIDNYDSFSYNLYQYVGTITDDIKVVRNDELTIDDIRENKNIQKIILSPGPGRPIDAGMCEDIVRNFKGQIPILGVCLGHQAICEALGGKIVHAKTMMHGKTSKVKIDNTSQIFAGLDDEITVGRYHSLAADVNSLPKDIKVTATAEDGEIMAVELIDKGVYGIQFHPESILTPDGYKMIENFIGL